MDIGVHMKGLRAWFYKTKYWAPDVVVAFCASPKAILGLPPAQPIEVSDVNQSVQGQV